MNTKNLSLIFRAVPNGLPVPRQHLSVEPRPLSLSDIPKHGFIVKNLYSSLDPYMRLMLIPPEQKHYREPFTLGEPLYSWGLAEVMKSDHQNFPTGSIIKARLPIQQYTVFTAEMIRSTFIELLPSSSKFHIGAYLGPLGMPGQTAYASTLEIGKPVVGETIFISAASGAVGQLVGQICKKKGLRVVGSVGSQDKLDLITGQLGFDDGFIYKNEDSEQALTRLCPHGIDIYFDNVGGRQLEAAINHMNKYGRIIVCGMVSEYNIPVEERYGIKNLMRFVGQGITMRGFLVGDRDMQPKWDAECRRQITQWLDQGDFPVVMSEAVGIERGAEAFAGMLKGKNKGKAVLRIWGEDGEEGKGEEDLYREMKIY